MKSDYRLGIDETIKKYETSKNGLTSKQVEERMLKYGRNVLPKAKSDTIFHIFFRQFINPIIFVLMVAAGFSFLIGEKIDGWFILAIIIFNSLLGTIQEWRADQKAKSLQDLIKVDVKVIRDNFEQIVSAEELVVGDVVVIESGSKISADLRLFVCQNLTIDEAVLTGESVPSNKTLEKINEKVVIGDRKNMAYAGSIVFNGRGKGIVVATGINSEIGKIVDSVLLSKSTKSPLVIRMEKFTKQIAIITGIIAIVLSLLLFYRGEAIQEIFFSVVALSVSAIPEGLPVVLTVALTLASTRMSRRNVLVKKLNAVESLGSCTVIATDKTGTLTSNQQTAKLIVLPDGRDFSVGGVGYNGEGEVKKSKEIMQIAKMGIVNNEASLYQNDGKWNHFGDSIDVAFLALGLKAGVSFDKKNVLARIPYESEQKYAATFFKNNGLKCTVKGSYEKVIQFCSKMLIDGKEVEIDLLKVEKQHQDLAEKGYRVIALAEGDIDEKSNYLEPDIKNLTFLGLVAFIDPIREEAIDAIKRCRAAGIKVVMITGDHPLTAYAIARELSLVDDYGQVTEGIEVDDNLENNFEEFVNQKIVFSRVSPLQKLAVVNAFKIRGEFIAVTGDGVNDAPALKAANIGVAVGSGTDVAKETSTMIITDDNFSSIVAGVEEGRVAYSNVRKVILMLLSTGIAEVLLFMLAIILNLPLPLIAVQILWLNLVTNGIQDVALAFEKGEPGIMREKPREPNEKIFNQKLLEQTFLAAIVIAIIVFSFWNGLLDIGVPVEKARGYVLLLMVFMQNVHIFNCRSETLSLFKMKFSSNPYVFVAILVTLFIHFLITQTSLSVILSVEPIPFSHMFYVFVLALPIIVVMEIYKKIRSKNGFHIEK